ncbi:MAG: DNA polymerase III subunit gamma/tau [Defluviitaleaceae bacterium]|nr:DNA polymerase III subunit gamma/tau [Defluviitaleaceae bacterium]
MSHTALYRKKRPRAFDEMVGQQHIVKTLVNQLLAGQINHAYLFCGTRGTGKTSAAKILARAINCLALKNGEPCNTCELCQSILAERCLDVSEIDAASNNGVENIRDLRDEVKYLPTQGRYKVYIVDEVHMLSTNAFNALLKTLEEPPAHVVFILATTDPQKIPATILSRCQRYDFRRISAANITETLKKYLNEENLMYENTALEYIAYHADGGMRDALSLLDQSISMSDEINGVTLETVREMLGAVDRAKLFEFADALAINDSRTIMTIISEAMNDGRDVSQFVSDLIRHFRDILVAGFNAGADFSQEMTERLAKQSKAIPNEQLMIYIHTFSETLREMRFAPHMRTAFEVCALKLCMPSSPPPIQVSIPTAPAPTPAVPIPPPQVSKDEIKPVPDTPVSNHLTSDTPLNNSKSSGGLNEIITNWGKLCKAVPMPLRSWLGGCGVESADGLLKIISDNETTITLIKGKQSIIRETLAEIFNLSTPPNLAFEAREGYNKGSVTMSSQKDESRPMQHEQSKIQPTGTPLTSPTKAQSPPNDWADFGQATMMNDEEW